MPRSRSQVPATAILAAAVVAAGCYHPEIDRCAVTCERAGVCPGGMTCSLDDGYCHEVGDRLACPPVADGAADDASHDAPIATADAADAVAPLDAVPPFDAFPGWVSGPCDPPGTMTADFSSGMPGWLSDVSTGTGSVSILEGALRLSLPTVGDVAAVQATSIPQYDERRLYVRTVGFLEVTAANCGFWIGLFAAESRQLMMGQDGGGVLSVWLADDTVSPPVGATQVATRALSTSGSDAWWQMRETDGQVFFETSPDGVHWTELTSLPTPSWMSSTPYQIRADLWGPPGPNPPGAAGVQLMGDCPL